MAAAAPTRVAIRSNHKTRQGNFLGYSAETLLVDSLGILGHHSIAAKKRHESLNRSLHHRDPAARNSFFVAVVVARRNFLGEDRVHRFSLAPIGFFIG